MLRKAFLFIAIIFSLGPALSAEQIGSETVLDLASPELAGRGAFVTSQGGAPASMVNPAAAGDAQRIVFDAGAMMLLSTSAGGDLGIGLELGALFPTKYAVLGGSLHFLTSPGFDDYYPVGTAFGGNLSVAKELYPGFNVGLGLNLAGGQDADKDGVMTLAGDIGIRHNIGKAGPLQNFTYGFVFRGLGKSYMPAAFTPDLGVGFDVIHLYGRNDKPDPLAVKFNADFSFPSFENVTGKFGVSATVAELVTLAMATGFNAKDWQTSGRKPKWIPSIGLTVNLGLLSSGKRIAGGRLPSDGDLGISMGFKPLYADVIALGPGVSWSVGVLDKKPPVITVDYSDTMWISPNNDGKADALEFAVTIADQRYVAEWKMEIFDAEGNLVRTYRNKETRVETLGFKNMVNRLIAGKAGVEVPPSFRWDGIFDSGDIASDGAYTFVISAADDNDNAASTEAYTVMVDNTAPEVSVEEIADANKIFSPDGDGNKDTIAITQDGSVEDLWDGGIYNAAGEKTRSFMFRNAPPEPFVWDGSDDMGRIVPDGVYNYRIFATDRALNYGEASMGNIIVSTLQPKVSLTINDAFFSPNGDGVKDTLVFNALTPVQEGITGWSVTVRDSSGMVLRTIAGNPGDPVPVRLVFDGRGDSGLMLAEGAYNAKLSVNYRNGYVSESLSPVFTLDVTPPRAVVRTEYNAFSPNNDGVQDEMIFIQEGSAEILWIGEIRRAGAPASERPVRTMRFAGTPPARVTWDGFTDTGSPASDGDYAYQLTATDLAGNTGGSAASGRAPVTFALSTADTPVMISADLRAFSPNNDRNKDTINIIPQLQVTSGLSSWRIDILNGAGETAQSFNGTTTIPGAIPWNGRDAAGAVVPDGNYTARIEVRYAAGNQPSAVSRPFAVDTVRPRATVDASYTLFSPNEDSRKDTLPIRVVTEGDDTWEASIVNARGEEVQSWDWTGTAPASLVWDGSDKAGNTVPDGAYRFVLSSTDEAGNSATLGLDAITVDARVPRAFLTANQTAVAPKGGPAGEALRFSAMLTLREGIESWTLELKDEAGTTRRRFPAPGSPTAAPPETISWNGYDDNGILREGSFTPQLSVSYTKGDLVTVSAPPVMVDVTGPSLSFSYEPEFFSPDNDGVDDELIMRLDVQDKSPIASWSLEIRERDLMSGELRPFYRIEGRGSPAERVIWDGRSSRGELVQSATDYPYLFQATDALGNTGELDGNIEVDILVIRDGDNLKIQVPSIIFRANQADFNGKDVDPVNGLSQEQIDNNNRVLRRIAQSLNKFREYRVQVEGHANPTSRNPPPAEAQGDLELSERRARAVVDSLVGFGVNRNRLGSIGRGSSRPIIVFDDRPNWWKNRRVEFILIK
jgi:flagellar hook assembly protein FlgD